MGRRRSLIGVALAAFLIPVGLGAERAWVSNRGGSTVTLFDTNTNLEESGSPITVGAGPIDIASDSDDLAGPHELFVVNSGSNSISIISASFKTVVNTITSSGTFGAFTTPSGVCRMSGPGGPTIAVVDQKVTTGPPAGRSTIRFINPNTNQTVDSLRDASPTARYNDVVWTSNGRLWIADDGDKGVVVVRLGTGVPPFGLGDTLLFTGGGEFTDFVHDPNPAPSYLVAPRRLATNGTTRVVAADGASDTLTVIDAAYPAGNEAAAILNNLNLGLPAGVFCNDVEVIGNFAYVTTTAATGQVLRISLLDYAKTVVTPGAGATVAGLGRTTAGTKLYVGGGSGTTPIFDVSVSTFSVSSSTSYPSGSFPFGFYSSTIRLTGSSGTMPIAPPGFPAPGVDPNSGIFVGFPSGGGGGGGGHCGLLGVEVLLLFCVRRFARRFTRNS